MSKGNDDELTDALLLVCSLHKITKYRLPHIDKWGSHEFESEFGRVVVDRSCCLWTFTTPEKLPTRCHT